MTALVVNLFGGPGTGKSTTAAGVFAALKYREVNVEMAREYAKDLVWAKAEWSLHNQLHVFGEQHHRIWTLLEQVEVVVTDSPLLLSLIYYRGDSETFRQLVLEEHRKLRALNVFLRRTKRYNPSGRLQTEEEARGLDQVIWSTLRGAQVPVYEVVADSEAVTNVLDLILPRIGRDE